MSKSLPRYAALMYHGIYASADELNEIPAEDRPYSVSADTFRSHMELLKTEDIEVITHQQARQNSPLNKNGVLLTFDDGDKGWIRYALPILKEYGYEGTFFVTSDLIESRDHFCSWEDIKELADSGMNIQSHGKTHLFFADLNDSDCENEFLESKQHIENHTTNKINTISFPGGRYIQRDIDVGKKSGYTIFHTSKFGTNLAGETIIKRVAIRDNTSLTELKNLITQNPLTLYRHHTITWAKDIIKKLLGNMGYHVLYRIIRGS